MQRFVARRAPLALVPIAGWVILVQFERGNLVTWALVPLAVVAAAWGWISAREFREGRAFIGFAVFLVLGAAAIFGAVYPVVLPSTLSPAVDLTISNASSAPYTLQIMSIVAAFGLPVVLVYQAWSYWVFRRRIAEIHIPEAHVVQPAVRVSTEK
jgi:cytochrome d ubiquinol oxidase subunit II